MFAKPKLTELERGIYLLGDKAPDNETPAVVVHPYYDYIGCPLFFGRPYLLAGTKKNSSSLDYTDRINDFISSYKGPVIIMESGPTLDLVVKQCRKLGRKNGVYFVKTENHNPTLTEISFENFARFCMSFGNDRLNLAGGRFQNRSYPVNHFMRKACLWIVQDDFGHHKIGTKLLEDLVY